MTTNGQIIRKLRRERNMTQEELAAKINESSQAVSKQENETTAHEAKDRLFRLSSFLGTVESIVDFCTGSSFHGYFAYACKTVKCKFNILKKSVQ